MNLKQSLQLTMTNQATDWSSAIYLTRNEKEKNEIHDSEICEEDQRDDGKRILT